jgi:hypothetical protein
MTVDLIRRKVGRTNNGDGGAGEREMSIFLAKENILLLGDRWEGSHEPEAKRGSSLIS